MPIYDFACVVTHLSQPFGFVSRSLIVKWRIGQRRTEQIVKRGERGSGLPFVVEQPSPTLQATYKSNLVPIRGGQERHCSSYFCAYKPSQYEGIEPTI